jgi:DNA polymerase-3 subunit beta
MASKTEVSEKVEVPEGAARLPRFRVRAGTLADALKDVAGAVEGRNTIPILSNVLVEVTDSRITLTATDLDMWVVRGLASADPGEPDSAEWRKASRDFGMTVPAKVLAAVLAEIDPDAMVTLTGPDGTETRATLKAGRARFRLPCLPVADFPLPPPLQYDVQFDMAASALADAFARVEHAISTEETRYYLNGVFVHAFQLEGSAPELRFAATDGHRLARVAVAAPLGSEAWPDTIVARRSVALLDKLLAGAIKVDADTAVQIAASGSRLRFDMVAADVGSVSLVAKAIDGSFPDYARVIPSAPPLRATLDRGALAAAVKRVAVLAAKQSRIVSAEFESGKVTLRSSSAELGEADEELPCAFTQADGSEAADGLKVGLDSAYWRAALTACGADEVAMLLSDAGAPVRIEARTYDSDDEAPALVQVVMPARV